MTISESRNILKDRYIKWYTTAPQMNNYRSLEDANYSWWEREQDCQEWSSKEGTYVSMSDSKTLKVMRGWFKKIKNN
tara:strand:- start:145 stop:375 length:231 start_codon:yes stop_codon:yes gene_type:complete